MIVGGYELHLYCDCCKKYERLHKHGPHPDVFAGQTRAGCMRQARQDGWTFRKGKCRCSECGGEGKSFPKDEVADEHQS